MDQAIEATITARKKAIDDYYSIPASEESEVAGVFSEMETLGTRCAALGKFEKEFAASGLNDRYLALFTKLKVKKSVCANAVAQSFTQHLTNKDQLVQDVKDEAAYAVDTMTQPARHETYVEAYDELRDVPVVGDIVSEKGLIGQVAHLFKKKK